MAATLHRPPGHQGPVAGSPASCINNEPSSAQPAPGPHSAVHEPGSLSHPQPPVFVRPLVYVHAPPPPPFLQYQWPMSSFYNPFGGIPGYGMVLPPPPFLPPSYLEAPPYVLPHPQIPPVEYRRLPHQPGHSHGYHQHPHQTCRTRVPQTAPVRQTTNSEVQTEPTQRGGHDVGWLPLGSDSGRGTAPNSPNSSSARSQKEASADLENFGVSGSEADGPSKNVFSSDSTGASDVQTGIKGIHEVEKDNGGQSSNHECKHDLPEDAEPACSSSQKDDEACGERRTSVPDILLNWGGSTPKTVPEKGLPQDCNQPEQEKNNSTDAEACPAVVDRCSNADGIQSCKDGEMLSKIVRFPFVFINPVDDKLDNLADSKRRSLIFGDELERSSQNLPDCEHDDCDETFAANDTMESIVSKQSFSSYWTKRKMDESIWSVESLVPFIPNKEWLLLNDVLESEGNAQLASPAQSDCRTVKVGKESMQSSALFASDFNPDTFYDFKILDDKQSSSKKSKIQTESHENGPECTTSLEKEPLASLVSKATSISDDENGSSEQPEAEKRNPNQESFQENGLQEDGLCSAEGTLLHSSVAEEGTSPSGQATPQNGAASEVEEAAEGSGEKSPEAVQSKGHLVDCGVQCDDFQDQTCVCAGRSSNLDQSNKSEIEKLNNGNHESFCSERNVRKKQNGQKRSKTQEHGGKTVACNGNQKSGKAKDGNGRSLQH
ncbi:uncharacterized protein LOC112147057 isoform X2 [Oryzias melastigma]|uniref:uncharacterized protein LOC112147057 isoform X2 n=1 Tax=Oryzias melastigma TaxID=30732 RepID=UPI000CF7C728|nr:uncharacterized protein LOC112147057 isoform X2 [Oryzias melastigma]